ncbi:hypothetical protein [Bordetella genomosp. 1]|nr:hypothetical protein [Bordetella genomosp. 1]
MTIIQKPRARQFGAMWAVWCDLVGPTQRPTLEDAYRAWAQRRGWHA